MRITGLCSYWKAEFVTVQATANPSAGSVGRAADMAVPQLVPALSVTARCLMAGQTSHASMTLPPWALRYSHFCTAVCKRYRKARKNPSVFDILRSGEEGLRFCGFPPALSAAAPRGLTPSLFSYRLGIRTADVSARLVYDFA